MVRIVDRSRLTELTLQGEATRFAFRGSPDEIPADARTEIVVSDVLDLAALETKWRDLETRSNPSFFQSWTWTGCLAEERFPNPVLVEARENGRTVALALFNRRGQTFYLGESGDPELDCIYIEFNGVLAEAGLESRLTTACLGAVRAWSGIGRSGTGWSDTGLARIWRRRLVLSGISSAAAISAEEIGAVRRTRSLAAPFVDVVESDDRFLASRGTNTRHQLRRSNRGYAATGAVTIDRADTLALAYEYLDGLEVLHQASWAARERVGAFAKPFFGRFHRALIARGLGRGEIDLFRIAAGPQTVGFLYNFRYRERSLAYQSGFDYAGAGRHEKPGLTCHHMAIRFAARWGAARYDFLAGDDRYKRSLSDRADHLHWIEVASPYSPGFLARRVRDFVTSRARMAPRVVGSGPRTGSAD